MYARSLYSHNELLNKNQPSMHEMIHDKGLNWANLEDIYKNGTFICKEEDSWVKKHNVIFKRDREIIDKLLIPEEE